MNLSFTQSLTLSDIREVLSEFLGSIGDDGGAAEAERDRNRVKRMLTALGFEGDLETAPVNPPAAPSAIVNELRGDAKPLLGVVQTFKQ